MAKIYQEFVVLKVSKLIKDTDENSVILDETTKSTIVDLVSSVLGELGGGSIIVELDDGT